MMDKSVNTRNIAKFIQLLLIFVCLSACMKLEEKEVLLDNYCGTCKEMLQDSLLNLPGIYFVEYQTSAKSVKIKYHPKTFKLSTLHNFLGRYGFMSMGEESPSLEIEHHTPPCCK